MREVIERIFYGSIKKPRWRHSPQTIKPRKSGSGVWEWKKEQTAVGGAIAQKMSFRFPLPLSRNPPHSHRVSHEERNGPWGGEEYQVSLQRTRKLQFESCNPTKNYTTEPPCDRYWLVGRHFGETVQSQGSRKGGAMFIAVCIHFSS